MAPGFSGSKCAVMQKPTEYASTPVFMDPWVLRHTAQLYVVSPEVAAFEPSVSFFFSGVRCVSDGTYIKYS